MPDPEYPHWIYFWRVQDRKGRWYTTRHRCTEESIRIEHPEAKRVDAGALEIKGPSGSHAHLQTPPTSTRFTL